MKNVPIFTEEIAQKICELKLLTQFAILTLIDDGKVLSTPNLHAAMGNNHVKLKPEPYPYRRNWPIILWTPFVTLTVTHLHAVGYNHLLYDIGSEWYNAVH